MAFIINFVSRDQSEDPQREPRHRQRAKPPPHSWWFRGCDSPHHALDAALFRVRPDNVRYPEKVETYRQLEQLINHEYIQMTRGRFPNLAASPWDRLFDMQHYGLPTRLLDWSINLGQAIWFALKPPPGPRPPRPHEPVIWILNPRLLSQASLGEAALNDFAYLEAYGTQPEMPWFDQDAPSVRPEGWLLHYLAEHPWGVHFPILPRWNNPRLSAQMGCFTLQSGCGPGKTPSLDQFARDAVEKGQTPFLYKVCLKGGNDEIEKARASLSLIGVNEYTMFPELHTTCAWIGEIRNLRG